MEFPTARKIFRIRLLLLTGTFLIIAIVFTDVFLRDSRPIGSLLRSKNMSSTKEQKLVNADGALHARLWQLQHMDRQFASLLSTQKDKQGSIIIHRNIQQAENAFAKAIDSIEKGGSGYDQISGTNDFQNMTTFFKTILENRRFLSYLRSGLVSDDNELTADHKTMIDLQNQLFEKDKIIAAWEAKTSTGAIAEIQKEVEQKNKEIQNLTVELKNLQAEKGTYIKSVEKLQSNLAEKDLVIAGYENKKTPLDQKTLVSLQNGIAEKDKQLKELQGQIQRDQVEKKSYAQNIQKYQQQLNEKDKMIAALGTRNSADQKSLQNAATESTNKQLRDLHAQLQKEQSEKSSYSQTIQKIQKQLSEKDKMISALSNIKVPVSPKVQSVPNVSDKSNKQIRDLQAQLQKEESEKQTYFQTIQRLQGELIEKNKAIVAWERQKLAPDQQALVALQKQITDKNNRIRSLEDQLQSVGSRVNTSARVAAGGNVQDLQQSNNNLRLAYNNTVTQLGVLQKRYNLLKAEMDQIKSTRSN